MCVPLSHRAHALLKLCDLGWCCFCNSLFFLFCYLLPFPDLCFVCVVLATCLAQIQKNATNKQTKGYKRQLNLVKLVLATPSKSKQCMIMLVPFDFRLAGLARPWNTKAAEAKPVPNFWSSAMMPCATSKTATKLFARLLYRRLSGRCRLRLGMAAMLRWPNLYSKMTCPKRWLDHRLLRTGRSATFGSPPCQHPEAPTPVGPRSSSDWAKPVPRIGDHALCRLGGWPKLPCGSMGLVGEGIFCRTWELNLPQTCCSSYKVLPVSAGARFVVMRCGVSV